MKFRRAMIRTLCAATGLALATGLASTALAGSQTGKITWLHVRSDDLVFFELEGVHASKPPCAASRDYWIIKDENATYGKAQFAMLMSAWLSGKTVTVYGANTCTRLFDGEDVLQVSVSP